MEKRSRRITAPWLRSINQKSLPYLSVPARFTASTNVQCSLSNHDHIDPQRHPNTPQYEPEHSATAHHIISTPSSPARPSCAAKRKAHDVVPNVEEPRDCHSRHVSTSLTVRGGVSASGGSAIWIEETETTTSLENPTQRVTESGSEIHSKRARRAAIDVDDGEFFRFLVPCM
jgi:hypothetical protein